jgi:hypothetical protein
LRSHEPLHQMTLCFYQGGCCNISFNTGKFQANNGANLWDGRQKLSIFLPEFFLDFLSLLKPVCGLPRFLRHKLFYLCIETSQWQKHLTGWRGGIMLMGDDSQWWKISSVVFEAMTTPWPEIVCDLIIQILRSVQFYTFTK